MADFLTDNADFDFNIDAAAIGAQGADIFFFHRVLPLSMPGKSLRKIGSAIHRAKPAIILDAFKEYCTLSMNKDIAKSYIYGFILHYALDRRCHPYVYAFEKRICERNRFIHHSSAHNRIELAMDSVYLNKQYDITRPSDFDSAAVITTEAAVMDEIAHLLSFVVSAVTNFSISEKQAVQAIHDTKRMQKILRDKSSLLRHTCRIVETVLAPFIGYYKFSSMIKPNDLEKAKKYGNINKVRWISPFDENTEHFESFDELFTLAAEDAKMLIKGYNAIGLSSYEITHNISFLTGLEVK